MKKVGMVAALVVGTALTGFHSAAAESTSPPTDLKLVGDHWTPWDPPAAGPDAYIIEKGDTLWDLAGRWMGDPYLWPQIWDENRYVLDSHWIYPGDPLVIPGRPTVVPETGILPSAEITVPPTAELPPDEPTEVVRRMPEKPPLVPVAVPAEIYCSSYIDPEPAESDLWVAGREMELLHPGQGNVVYVNRGRDMGIKAGGQYGILRPTDEVEHPVSGAVLGTLVRRMGRVRVLLAHRTSATVVIDMACEDIQDGDQLVPWVDIESPMLSSMPTFERYNIEPSGGATGHIVAAEFDLVAMGAGHLISVDLGLASGVEPGSVLTLYRDNEALPRLNIGQAVILTVEPVSSTAKIVLSIREARIADRVEVVVR